MKNNTSLKLKIEKFFTEQLWQLLIVIAFLFIVAFVFDKYIESIFFCISHTLIRNAFKKQYHCGTTALCLTFTLGIAWFGINITMPITLSIVSSNVVCFIVAFLGFIAQDRLDCYTLNKELEKEILTLKESHNIELYKMNETELRQFGASRGLSELQQDILVHKIIEHLKISEICNYRNYGRTTIKYHIAEIKRKLNIDTL